ncbi:hypothetical protein ESCO_003966 [Escovopsis weberi]|uniref:Uncharacterized protein n=1 Tax=Escovopsis weberi TaxID=150374 RepID=A0A0M8N0T8_ESCWE|nr:hypothetical protein ESCO_003966 [Escovopsis weberi]
MADPPSSSPLSLASLAGRMADALPTHASGDDSSDIASSYEVIALLVHAYLSALNFRLYAFDDAAPLDEECQRLAPRLPPQWNRGFGSLGFAYRHKQSTLRFVIRVDRMGSKTDVRGLAVGDDKIHHFEVVTRDVVAGAKLPLRIPFQDGHEDRSHLGSEMHRLFASSEAMQSVITQCRENIVQKLIPKLCAEDYHETEPPIPARAEPGPAFIPPQAPPVPGPIPAYPTLDDPPRLFPRGPVPDFPPPGFEDEHQTGRLPHGPYAPPLGAPLPRGIGHDDLNPPALGPFDPLRPSLVPGHQQPIPPGGFSGMHPTFDDPLFTGEGDDGYGGTGRGRGRVFNPQAPPGARWDPIGPGGNPRFPGPNGGGGNFGGSWF